MMETFDSNGSSLLLKHGEEMYDNIFREQKTTNLIKFIESNKFDNEQSKI